MEAVGERSFGDEAEALFGVALPVAAMEEQQRRSADTVRGEKVEDALAITLSLSILVNGTQQRTPPARRDNPRTLAFGNLKGAAQASPVYARTQRVGKARILLLVFDSVGTPARSSSRVRWLKSHPAAFPR